MTNHDSDSDAHEATAKTICRERPIADGDSGDEDRKTNELPHIFELVVIEGIDRGLRFNVDPHSAFCALIGQSPVCAIRLSDATVSPRHCSLEQAEERGSRGIRLVSLSTAKYSKSTRVNGVDTTEAFLTGGEVIRVGDTVIEVRRCVSRRRDETGVSRTSSRTSSNATSFGRLQGASNVMRELYPKLAILARHVRPVLIVGERGVGKRLCAEEIHRHGNGNSTVDTRPFICAQRDTADDLARSLFDPGGLVDRARGGTLFIPEVSDLDPAGQQQLASILLAMQRGDGDDFAMRHRRARTNESRVRVIVGTRRAHGSRPIIDALLVHFAARIALPPLRAREGDVLFLARRFWSELGGAGGLPDDLAARFSYHRWTGNVRELRIAVMDRLVHGADSDSVDLVDVEPQTQPPASSGVVRAAARASSSSSSQPSSDPLNKVIESDLPFIRARNEVLAEFERRYVAHALERADRNVGRAAAASGIAHRYFQVLKSRRRYF